MAGSDKLPPYEVFIPGETMDLCIPNEQAVLDGWTSWFNDPRTTRFLNQGVFPNHVENQRAFLKAVQDGQRLALLICSRGGEDLWGVISLSAIDYVARSAQISLVVGGKTPTDKLVALEAMARVTEHAFLVMGLERVWAGQAFPGLRGWNERLETIGFRTEGIIRRGFVKGRTISNTAQISILYEDYLAIVERRRHYWLGNEIMKKLCLKRPKPGLADTIAAAIDEAAAAATQRLIDAEMWAIAENVDGAS